MWRGPWGAGLCPAGCSWRCGARTEQEVLSPLAFLRCFKNCNTKRGPVAGTGGCCRSSVTHQYTGQGGLGFATECFTFFVVFFKVLNWLRAGWRLCGIMGLGHDLKLKILTYHFLLGFASMPTVIRKLCGYEAELPVF